MWPEHFEQSRHQGGHKDRQHLEVQALRRLAFHDLKSIQHLSFAFSAPPADAPPRGSEVLPCRPEDAGHPPQGSALARTKPGAKDSESLGWDERHGYAESAGGASHDELQHALTP